MEAWIVLGGWVILEITHDNSAPFFTTGNGNNIVLSEAVTEYYPVLGQMPGVMQLEKSNECGVVWWPSRSWDGLSPRGTLERPGLNLWYEQQCVSPEARAEIKASANGVSLWTVNLTTVAYVTSNYNCDIW